MLAAASTNVPWWGWVLVAVSAALFLAAFLEGMNEIDLRCKRERSEEGK